jgi:hypothetical protein
MRAGVCRRGFRIKLIRRLVTWTIPKLRLSLRSVAAVQTLAHDRSPSKSRAWNVLDDGSSASRWTVTTENQSDSCDLRWNSKGFSTLIVVIHPRSFMHRRFLWLLPAVLFCPLACVAATAPFDPENWPPTRDAQKHVHYIVTDGSFTPPGNTWLPNELRILSGGDQVTTAITIGGHAGLKVAGNFLNIADQLFTEWADDEVIDILMQIYGDAAVLNAAGAPRNFNFLTGIHCRLRPRTRNGIGCFSGSITARELRMDLVSSVPCPRMPKARRSSAVSTEERSDCRACRD